MLNFEFEYIRRCMCYNIYNWMWLFRPIVNFLLHKIFPIISETSKKRDVSTPLGARRFHSKFVQNLQNSWARCLLIIVTSTEIIWYHNMKINSLTNYSKTLKAVMKLYIYNKLLIIKYIIYINYPKTHRQSSIENIW
jgi:hypothetical protein